MSATFTARYHGRCACCEEHIEPGDTVGYEHEALVCESCMEADGALIVPVRAERAACPECWLVHAGSCEDDR